MISAFQDATWQAIAWTAVVFLVGFIFGRRTGGGRDLTGPPRMRTSEPSPGQVQRPATSRGELDPDVRADIELALNAGQKIEAIKLLREATGMGLKEAKDAVEEGRF